MMHLEIQDWAAVEADIQGRTLRSLEAIEVGFERVGAEIVDQFQDEQLSGRKADDTGLNVVSGTLHGSIQSAVEVADAMVSSTVYNENAPYWEYHQLGMGHNPKRLFFDEYFESQGFAAYTAVAERALAEGMA